MCNHHLNLTLHDYVRETLGFQDNHLEFKVKDGEQIGDVLRRIGINPDLYKTGAMGIILNDMLLERFVAGLNTKIHSDIHICLVFVFSGG